MGSPNGAAAEPESGTGPGKVNATSEPATNNTANPPSAAAAAAATAAAGAASSAAAATHVIKDADQIHPSDQYCLRWTNHGSHVINVFSQLLHDEDLVDVTLAAEGQSLRAHKMVLSACSSFFRSLFASHPERYPIIILKDTRFDELKTLLEFMYKGEVNVEHGQLDTLLKTAENLRVKGLAEVCTDPSTTRRHPGGFGYDRTNTVVAQRDAENSRTSRHQQEQLQQQLERRFPKPRPRYPYELPREKLRHLLRYRPYSSRSRSRRQKRHRRRSPRAFSDARCLGDDSHTRESSDFIEHVQPPQPTTNVKPWPPDYDDSDESDDESSDTTDVQDDFYPRNPYWPPTRLPTVPYHHADSRIAYQQYRAGKELQPMQNRTAYEPGFHPVSSKHLRTSRSSSSSELYSESSQHSDQFSDDQMPAAEVLIEEGDFITPGGDFSSERSFGATGETYRSRKRRRDQYSVEIFPSGPVAEGTTNRKRFIAFRSSDYQASDSPGSFAHTGREIPEELTISAVRRQGSERGSKLASSNASAPCVSIIPAQYDVRRRPAGLPISRSATSSPRPVPSSARGFDVDEEGDGEQGTASAAELGSRTPLLYRRPLSSVSLIESHVGVGFTLGSREKPYKCEQCGQCYKYLSAFTKHKEQNHTAKLPGDKPFRCDICGMQFKYLKSFKKHRLNHTVERLHPDQPQPNTAEGRSLLDILSTDTRSENASPLTTCSLPPDKEDDELPSNMTIKEEVVRQSSAEESDDAERDASDTGIAQGNIRLVSPSRLQQQVVICPNCHLRFINEESLKLHSVNCTESVMPSAVPVQPSGASALNSEDESAGPSGMQEILRQQLRAAHKRTDLPADEAAGEGPSSLKPSSVRSISLPSKDSAASTNPAPAAPPAPVPPAPPQDYDPSRPHLCQYCGKGFKAKENLKLHIRKHTGEKPFECEFCGRAFGGKSDMNRHLRIHTGERPYRCDACGKTFARADYLSKHLSTHMT